MDGPVPKSGKNVVSPRVGHDVPHRHVRHFQQKIRNFGVISDSAPWYGSKQRFDCQCFVFHLFNKMDNDPRITAALLVGAFILIAVVCATALQDQAGARRPVASTDPRSVLVLGVCHSTGEAVAACHDFADLAPVKVVTIGVLLVTKDGLASDKIRCRRCCDPCLCRFRRESVSRVCCVSGKLPRIFAVFAQVV